MQGDVDDEKERKGIASAEWAQVYLTHKAGSAGTILLSFPERLLMLH